MSHLLLCSIVWLSCNSRSSPGRAVCKYLCISVQVAMGVLLLFWQFFSCVWKKASTVKTEGLQKRLENTAEPCTTQLFPTLGQWRCPLWGHQALPLCLQPGAEGAQWMEQGY